MGDKDNNFIKNIFKFHIKQNKNNSKHKTKFGNVEDNSLSQSADTIINGQSINQTFKVFLSEKQFNEIAKTATQEVNDAIKEHLMKHPIDVIKNGFMEISPQFFLTFANKQHIEQQVKILINTNLQEALKKQAIQELNFLTNRDLELLNLIFNFIKLTDNELIWNFSYNLENVTYKNEEGTQLKINIDYLRKRVEQKISEINSLINSYESKNGQINLSHFENMKRRGIIINDGNTNTPTDELVCKLFISECNDKSKNDEYENESISLRITENRQKWTEWFSIEKYSNTFVEKILKDLKNISKKFPAFSYWRKNDDFKMFYSISELGETIISQFNN